MNPQTFLYYDTELESWSTQDYTLAEIVDIPGVTEETHLSLPDGSRTLTVAQAREAYGEPDTFQRTAEYRLIEWKKMRGGSLDIAGLEAHMNAMAHQGWRCISFVHTTSHSLQAIEKLIGNGDASSTIAFPIIVACMERLR